MNYHLGADEQSRSALFVRYINPSDLQKLSYRMRDSIKARLSWDWINPQAWRLLGFEGGPVETYLERLVLLQRQWGSTMTASNRTSFERVLVEKYGYNPEDVAIWTDAYLELFEAGLVPSTISQPWTYEPTTLAEDIGGTVKKSIFPALALVGIAAVAVYGFTTQGIPGLAAKRRK